MAIRQLSPREAFARLRDGALLVDVRSAAERELAMAAGAQGVEREELEAEPSRHLPDPAREVVLICQRGQRSRQVADALAAAGYRDLASVEGGTDAWDEAGLPMRRADVDPDFGERYARHLRLPEVGLEGQRRLQAARILLVGAGGLGSPAAYYLAAAGIGRLRIADDDVVDRSNLQRQVLHTDARVGMPKVASAAIALSALNPRLQVEAVAERVTAANVERLLDGADVVVDGSDNFPARYLLNDACVALGKPLVHGAVHRFEGQASVFDAGRARGQAPCYRCLFPQPPPAGEGAELRGGRRARRAARVIGLVQATEAIKLVLGIGTPLTGRLLQFDALAMRFREIRFGADPDCPVCAPGRAWPDHADDAAHCTAG